MPRKTTTSTTEKPQADQATDLAGDRFEKFRARGMAMQNRAGHRRRTFVTDDPFVLGEEYGFTPPIEIQKPVYTDRLAIEEMSRAGNATGVLRLLFKDDYRRFLAALNSVGDDAEEVAIGVFIDIQAHFYGEGIVDELVTFPM